MSRTTSPHYQDPRTPIQKTLALIRPEAMPYRDEIAKRIADAGFKVLRTTIVKLTPEQASQLYADQEELPQFPLRIASLCTGPVQAMCLAKPEAIAEFRALLGASSAEQSRQRWPGSLRSYFGACGTVHNGIVGSLDLRHARQEIAFFFPSVLVEPALTGRQDQWRYLNTYVYPTLWDGVTEVAKRRPEDPVVELAEWLWRNNPNKPVVSAMDVQLRHEIAEMQAYCRDAVARRGMRGFESEYGGGDSAGLEGSIGGSSAGSADDAVKFALPVIAEAIDGVDDGEAELLVDRCPV